MPPSISWSSFSLHPHFFRMRELVRRRRRPRGEQKMMLRRRKPSPVSTLEATCRSWWVGEGFIVGFFFFFMRLKCEGCFFSLSHRQKNGVVRGRLRERRRKRSWMKDANLWILKTWTRKDSSRSRRCCTTRQIKHFFIRDDAVTFFGLCVSQGEN